MYRTGDKPMITTRTAAPADAKALLAIYTPYVEQTAITFEYDVPTLEEFTSRIQTTLRKFPYIIAEEDNEMFNISSL